VFTVVFVTLLGAAGIALVWGTLNAIIGYTPACVPDEKWVCRRGYNGPKVGVDEQRDDFMTTAWFVLAVGVLMLGGAVAVVVAAIRRRRD
jgi:hypothetical protein